MDSSAEKLNAKREESSQRLQIHGQMSEEYVDELFGQIYNAVSIELSL